MLYYTTAATWILQQECNADWKFGRSEAEATLHRRNTNEYLVGEEISSLSSHFRHNNNNLETHDKKNITSTHTWAGGQADGKG